MGYKGDVDEEQAADQQYDLSSEARRRQEAASLEDLEQNYGETADSSQEDANIEKAKAKNNPGENIDSAKNGEENPMNYQPGRGESKPPLKERLENAFRITKKKGIMAGLVALLGGGGILITGFGAPAMLLMQIADVFTNNFNDAHAAISIRTNANIAHKISSARNSFAETADGKCGIRCKHTTMSDATVRNLEARGFQVNPKEGMGKFNRRVVQSLTFPDGTVVYNGNQFKQALRDPKRAAAFNKVFNSRTAFFLNTKFGSMLKSKLGINKAYKLAGDSKEKFNESFRRAIGLPPAVAIDPNRPAPTPEETLKSNPKLSSTLSAIGRLGGRPTNAVAGACLAYNVNRAITASLKVAKYSAYAGFAMAFFNAAHKLKAADGGGIEPLVVSELGDRITYADPNKTKEDGNPNELYGLSATDSYGYKAAAYGDTGTMPEYAKANSMESAGVLGVLAALSFFASGDPTARRTASDVCRGADSPLALAAQCAPSLAGTPFAFAGCVFANFTIGYIIGEVIATIAPFIITEIVKANLLPLDENTKGAPLGDALYPGAAAILGGHAASYGMKTGTKDEIKNYIALTEDVRKQDIAIAKLEAKEAPFDPSNQYSFVGSLARNVNIAAYTNTNLTAGASLLSSLIPRSLATLTSNTHAGTYMPVAENKANQYGTQDCAALKTIGVDGDAYCMPAYTKNASELNADIEVNLNYMYDNGYINGDTGEPRTDNPAGREFQKFLDHCVFRIDAMGETSRAITEGDLGDYEWFIGRNCNLDTVNFSGATGSVEENVKNFRIYAMDEPISAEFNGEQSVLKSSTTPAPQTGGNGSGENSGNVNPEGWSFPTTAGAPLTQGYHDGHLALDIGSDPNAASVPIYAMRDGTVTSIGNMPMPPYQVACASPTGTTQQAVLVEHTVNGQKYISTYHHVEPGQFPFGVGSTVKAGDRIATMGNTGCSFGRHLHVELWMNSVHGGGTTVDLGAILY